MPDASDQGGKSAASASNNVDNSGVWTSENADTVHSTSTDYYADLKTKSILTKHGLYRYGGKKFATAKKLGYVAKGSVLHVVKIVKSGKTTRFILSDGSYVTALKSFSTFVSIKTGYKVDAKGTLYISSKKGVYEYTGKTFKHSKKVRHLKKGTVIHVKRVVKNGSVTRFQLTNGLYVTAKASMIKQLKKTNKSFRYAETKTVRVVNAKGVHQYKSTNFQKRNRTITLKNGTVLKVDAVVLSGNKTRFQLTNGHYVTANVKFVKNV